ncbi:hypothetical protein CAPTEDRAFT_218324, partial [Capitella teleta]
MPGRVCSSALIKQVELESWLFDLAAYMGALITGKLRVLPSKVAQFGCLRGSLMICTLMHCSACKVKTYLCTSSGGGSGASTFRGRKDDKNLETLRRESISRVNAKRPSLRRTPTVDNSDLFSLEQFSPAAMSIRSTLENPNAEKPELVKATSAPVDPGPPDDWSKPVSLPPNNVTSTSTPLLGVSAKPLAVNRSSSVDDSTAQSTTEH